MESDEVVEEIGAEPAPPKLFSYFVILTPLSIGGARKLLGCGVNLAVIDLRNGGAPTWATKT